VNAPAYRKRTAVDVHLRLLEHAIGEADAYEEVLNALSAGIRKSAQRIDRARPDDDAYILDETQIIENMLGTAYVVCQNEITAVVQAALRVDDAAKASIFTGIKSKRESDVRALGPQSRRKSAGKMLSKIEILWQLGNYFKHHDEWSYRRMAFRKSIGLAWKADNKNKHTVQVIKAVGLKALNSGNLRQGAKVLGNAKYSDVDVFQEAIHSWEADVRKHIIARLP
jgi:hypothetical protein